MAIRMGYWDCPSCNQKRIEGLNGTCTNCGMPRGPKIQFYTDDAAPEIADPEALARARAGTDWQCKFCGADNGAGKTECHQCGASADGMRKREERVVMDPTPPPKSRLPLLLAVIAAVVFLFGGCWFVFFRAKPMEVTVAAATWTKSVDVERLTVERGEGWSDEVPAGARELGRTTRDRAKKVQDGVTRTKVGKKDLGNGTFEDIYKEEPKYVTKNVPEPWVTYEVEKWVKEKTVEKQTTDGSEPPEPAAAAGARERLSNKQNKLVLSLEGKGKTYAFDVDLSKEGDPKAVVARYAKGKRFTAMVTAAGGVRELK